MTPLRGYIPKIFAACVLHESTIVIRSIRPALTPCVWMRSIRSWIDGMPLGIVVKASLPISFCPEKLKGA